MIPDGAWTGLVVALVLAGVALGAALFVGVPWLWGALRPLLLQALGAP